MDNLALHLCLHVKKQEEQEKQYCKYNNVAGDCIRFLITKTISSYFTMDGKICIYINTQITC